MLLRVKFHAEDNERVIRSFEDGYSNLIQYIKGDDWYEDASTANVRRIAIALKDKKLEDYVNAELINTDEDYADEEVLGHKYVYDDVWKKTFFMIKSEEWSSLSLMVSCLKSFILFEKYEVKFKKSVLEFNDNEIQDMINGIYQNQFQALRVKVKLLALYERFFYEKVHSKTWQNFYTTGNFVKGVTDTDGNGLVNKRELLDMFYTAQNAQDAIIPILLFEGVNMSTIEEKNEISKIKIEDIKSNGIEITEGQKRFIEMDQAVLDAVRVAAEQKYLARVGRGHQVVYLPLKKTPYLLRSLDEKRPRRYSENEDFMSYPGVRQRVLKFREEYALQYGVENVSPSVIQKSGEVFYVNKYVNEGYEVSEAVRMTLQRFGDWVLVGDYAEEKNIPTNITKVSRLKLIWEVNTGKK